MTSLWCLTLCTILPSLRDMTWKLFSQLPQEMRKFSDGVCKVAKHCAPGSKLSAKGLPILQGESTSGPITKKGSYRKIQVQSICMYIINKNKVLVHALTSHLRTRECKVPTILQLCCQPRFNIYVEALVHRYNVWVQHIDVNHSWRRITWTRNNRG